MSYYRTLTVNHAQVPSTQTNFPVLVSLSDATLKTVANGGHVQRSDGFDIGFYSDSALTTKLKWEMDRYDGAAGTVVAWVKIASLSSASDTVFYMGYGDTAITTDQSDKANTWSNSYISVYHLGDGTTLSTADALGANNGTNFGGVTAAAGQIDGCGSFTVSHHITLGSGINPAAITLSAWVKATSLSDSQQAVVVRNNGTQFAGVLVTSAGKLGVVFYGMSGFCYYFGSGSHTLSTGTWYHVAGTYNSSGGCTGYVDGAFDGDNTAATGTLDTTAASTDIGHDPVAAWAWYGLLDEVHIASVARSADWITTEYNNQSAPGSFITTGSETPTAVDVSVSLTGVAADPQIGVGTVTIGSVAPPVDTGGGGTTGRPSRTGMRLRPTEDKAVYLKGVTANPQVGQVMLLSEMRGVYEKYVAPIRRTEAQKTPEMPAGMRGLFKKVEKPIPPAVFVYQVGLPKLKSAVGTMTVKAFYEDIDEELVGLLDVL